MTSRTALHLIVVSGMLVVAGCSGIPEIGATSSAKLSNPSGVSTGLPGPLGKRAPRNVDVIIRDFYASGGRDTLIQRRERFLDAYLKRSDELCSEYLVELSESPADQGIHLGMLCPSMCDSERTSGLRRSARSVTTTLVCALNGNLGCSEPQEFIDVPLDPRTWSRRQARRRQSQLATEISTAVDWCGIRRDAVEDCSPERVSDRKVALARIIAGSITWRREKEKAQIERRRMADFDSYPLEAAVADLVRYHEECTLTSGLIAPRKILRERDELSLADLSSSVREFRENLDARVEAIRAVGQNLIRSEQESYAQALRDLAPRSGAFAARLQNAIRSVPVGTTAEGYLIDVLAAIGNR